MYWKLECPYCGKEIDPDFTDDWDYIYDEELFQKECPECGMVLNVTPHISIDFELEKCECQGENHVWELTKTDPKCCARMYCVHCGEERVLTPEEKIRYNIPSVSDYLMELNGEEQE